MYHPTQSDNAHHQHQFPNQINSIHSSAQAPIVCSPSLIRQPTTFESLTSTFQSFSLPTFPSPFRQSNSNSSHTLSSDPSFWPQPTNSRTNPRFPSSSSHDSSHPLSSPPHPTHDPGRILFSTWLQNDNRRHLLLVNTIGIALWDAEDLETLILTCWIRWDHLNLVTPNTHQNSLRVDSLDCLITPSSNHFLHNFEPVSAAVLPSIVCPRQVIFVLLFKSLLHRSSKLLTVSAHSGQVLNLVDLAGIAVELGTNRKTIVVATKSPLALHLYGWEPSTESNQLSLDKLSCSPILDLAPRPNTGDPVFHLGQTRLLAYASSKPPNERETHIATGPGFSFVAPPHGPHSPSIVESGRENREGDFGLSPRASAARNSSPAGIGATSWQNSVAPHLGAIDETARKLGGGLLNGVKYLSSWGQTLRNPNMDNINSPQAFHHSARNDFGIPFSQSAPLPLKVPASHLRHEEPHGRSHGNVQIIDLSGDTCSNQNSQRHQHSICHFKVSSDPLTYLSLNPSSNLLLTSFTEGHFFHIFELRPTSRVGKSYLNAYRPGNTPAQRETTVWHRYKLIRGFTSAEVVDVTWRWDSKIVSVLTEHGTNHLFAIHPAGGAAGVETVDGSRSSRGAIDPLSSIFGPRVHNPSIPQSLSVAVSAFEKIKHKPLNHHSLHSQSDKTVLTTALGPTGYFDHLSNEHENLAINPRTHHTRLAFVQPRPEQLSSSSRGDKHQVLFDSHKRLPSALLYEPMSNSLTLYNFEIKKKLLNSVTSGVSSGLAKNSATIGTGSDDEKHANSQVKSQASPSPSALSQIMQQQKHAGPKVNGPGLSPQSPNVFINSFAPVVWSLGAIHNSTMINTSRYYAPTFSNSPCQPRPDSNLELSSHSTTSGQNWTSFAELDTFSHSFRILPRSIYTSHQFDFYNFSQSRKLSFTLFPNQTYQSFNNNSSFTEQLARADFDHVKQKKLVVKREVQIQPGHLSNHQDSSDPFALSTVEVDDNFINPHFNGAGNKDISGGTTYNQMYAEPIRSAVEAVIDPTSVSPKSLLNLFPEFPNGRIARKVSYGAHQNPLISFRNSLASNVAPVVGVVNERVRKEFGKIASSATIGEAGRRRLSSAGYWNGLSETLGQRLNRKPEAYDVGSYVGEGITSVSFEDDQDEAIRIDRSLFDHQGPSSSSMNSFTSTNSLAHPNSDELGLESNSRFTQSTMDEDLTEDVSETWDGWTFEDDLEIKTQAEPKDRSSLPPEIYGGSLHQPGDVLPSRKEEVGWNSSMIHSILTANKNAGLVTRLQGIELKGDVLQRGDGPIDSQTDGKLPSPKVLSHLQVKENKADSDRNSGSRSSSALSTSTSASTSGEDSSSSKKVQGFQIDHSSKTPLVQKSSQSSRNNKSHRAPQNLKKR